jgi:hypothetical protein
MIAARLVGTGLLVTKSIRISWLQLLSSTSGVRRVARCSWHVYRKWNHKLFDEMLTAYKQGRMVRTPAFVQELGFFDNYIIPLAKKLKN